MRNWVSTTPMVVLALLLGSSGDARACGGTFCNTGPTAMPVDQTGENILFVMDGQNVEAHVQIQYQGAADRFAWVVPMPEIPAVTVGSQLLFQNLLQATVPQYGFSSQFDSCSSSFSPGSGGRGGASGAGGSGGSSASADGGVTVVYQKSVGAFDVTVLQGGTAQEVTDWLVTNGYDSIASAPAILADYVAQSYVFVAIRLTAGADTNEIHPLVFRYPGNQPCVPLKLTAVAAVENMGVRTFFLGDDRVYPTNYAHLELNPVRLDWSTFGSNYTQVVNRAVDSPVAGGQAFITEFAGASNVVPTFGVYSTSWASAPFTTLAPEGVVDELSNQGLASCDISFCQFSHPLILPLLQEYLPVPAGLSMEAFYGCLSCNAALIDAAAWDAAAFAADFETRIVEPALHAVEVLATYPFLTRLFTTISPVEMTEDPMFHARPDLTIESVSNTNFATRRVACNGQNAMILPDSREVAYSGTWPTFSSLMPWAERIEEVPLAGPTILFEDNSEAIDAELNRWNTAQGWPPPNTGGSAGLAGVSGAGAGGAAAVDAGANAIDDPRASGGGCGCTVPRNTTGSGFGIAFAAALVSLARRSSRARRSG